jgi:hypothetical protein
MLLVKEERILTIFLPRILAHLSALCQCSRLWRQGGVQGARSSPRLQRGGFEAPASGRWTDIAAPPPRAAVVVRVTERRQ